jgi:hypothetical protein
MLFNSVEFFLFLFIIVTANFFCAKNFKTFFLVLASFGFIGFYNPESLIVVFLLSVFNFLLAKKVFMNNSLFVLGIVTNVLCILLFNLISFSPDKFGFSISSIHISLSHFIVALGLSFYSLQNIAYLIEVHYGRIVAERRMMNYVLYTCFFPKIISGPIMLPEEFLPQIENTRVTKTDLVIGANRILLGLFKKMVIADRLATSVGSVFDHNSNYSGLTTLTAAYLFTIQMYFDFSGYTDMALGAAKMLGFDLKENFNLPLRSTSISEFWRRWHISLITFFTKYIYYPIVFKLRDYKKSAAVIGIALTFILSGIWHRISLTYFMWAVCHVVYLTYELFTKRARVHLSERLNKKFYQTFSMIIVFNLVCFSNIFFRSLSFERAMAFIKNIFHNFIPSEWLSGFIAPLATGGHQIDGFNFCITNLICILVLVFERRINNAASKSNFNISFVTLLILLITMFGVFNNGVRFIYMQF